MAKKAATAEVKVDRRKTSTERRASDRRQKSEPVKVERRKLERRKKVTRRRQIDPTTCERDYSGDEIAFMQALDEYKRKNGRMFPTCSEILEVIRELGYRMADPEVLAAEKAAAEAAAAEADVDATNDEESLDDEA